MLNQAVYSKKIPYSNLFSDTARFSAQLSLSVFIFLFTYTVVRANVKEKKIT